VPVNTLQTIPSSNFLLSSTAQEYYRLSFDPYNLSSDDEEYSMGNNVAWTTHGQRNCAARSLTAARLYLYLLPAAPKNWGQLNSNLNDYHSDPMEINSTFWIPDITDWWRQQQSTLSENADLSNVVYDIFAIIPHGVGVEARYSLARDATGWRQSKTTGVTLRKEVVVM
jgi:hypothetical protein